MDAIQAPLPIGRAVVGMAHCVFEAVMLLLHKRIHMPEENVGLPLTFADGTAALVFRETVIDRPPPRDPCILVVRFRLRAVHGRGHALFRRESLLNTLLFAGFPGLITKLWIAHDRRGDYRGLYEWDGAESAEAYARTLWWVLALVSVPGSIGYQIVPGLRRADLLAPEHLEPAAHGDGTGDDAGWWRPAESDGP